MDGHAAGDAALDGVLLVAGEVVAGLAAQEDEDLTLGVLVLRCRGEDTQDGLCRRPGRHRR